MRRAPAASGHTARARRSARGVAQSQVEPLARYRMQRLRRIADRRDPALDDVSSAFRPSGNAARPLICVKRPIRSPNAMPSSRRNASSGNCARRALPPACSTRRARSRHRARRRSAAAQSALASVKRSHATCGRGPDTRDRADERRLTVVARAAGAAAFLLFMKQPAFGVHQNARAQRACAVFGLHRQRHTVFFLNRRLRGGRLEPVHGSRPHGLGERLHDRAVAQHVAERGRPCSVWSISVRPKCPRCDTWMW